MATFEYDGSQDPDFIASLEADQAESERLGSEIQDAEQTLLAGKFTSAEELERGYIELQKLLGKGGADTEEPAADGEAPTEEESAEEDESEGNEEEPDFASYLAEEFATNGKLSEATLAELSKLDAGEVAAALLAAQPASQATALSESDIVQLQSIAGGPEKYTQMTAWAQENMAPEEVNAYNQVMQAGNAEAVYFAIQALKYRYQAEEGFEGKLLDRTKPPSGKGDVYRSQAEVQRAMNDPRYDSDAAYRQDVFEKLARSNDLDYS